MISILFKSYQWEFTNEVETMNINSTISILYNHTTDSFESYVKHYREIPDLETGNILACFNAISFFDTKYNFSNEKKVNVVLFSRLLKNHFNYKKKELIVDSKSKIALKRLDFFINDYKTKNIQLSFMDGLLEPYCEFFINILNKEQNNIIQKFNNFNEFKVTISNLEEKHRLKSLKYIDLKQAACKERDYKIKNSKYLSDALNPSTSYDSKISDAQIEMLNTKQDLDKFIDKQKILRKNISLNINYNEYF